MLELITTHFHHLPWPSHFIESLWDLLQLLSAKRINWNYNFFHLLITAEVTETCSLRALLMSSIVQLIGNWRMQLGVMKLALTTLMSRIFQALESMSFSVWNMLQQRLCNYSVEQSILHWIESIKQTALENLIKIELYKCPRLIKDGWWKIN